MNKIVNSLNKVTIRIWLLFLLMSQTIYFIMQSYSIPKISNEAGGLLIFDMKPLGYTYAYAYTFLSQLSEKGYELYKHIQLPLDILFPILNCLTALCTFALLIRFYNKVNLISKLALHSSFSKTALSLPLLAFLSDYAENIIIFAMLAYKSEIPKVLVYVSNIFTVTKSISTLVFYIFIIILFIISVVTWINNRTKGAYNDGKLRNKREKSSNFEGVNTGRNASSAKNKKSK